MELFFQTIELVCISLGAGGAFIFDTFFILCLKNHHIKQYESKALSRINLLSILATSFATLSFVIYLAFQLEQSILPDLGFVGIKLLLYALVLACGLTMRKIHLPALLRHQRTYIHLADHFKLHQDSLASTATYSTISWLYIISLTSVYAHGGLVRIFVFQNPFILLISFIIISYTVAKLSIFLKNNLLSTG